MRKVKNFLSFTILIVAIGFATSCQKIEFDPPAEGVVEAESNLVLKSASYVSVTGDSIYVQREIGTGLLIESKTGVGISSATWKIEGSSYQGAQISHKFMSLGKIPVEISAKFADGSAETRTFVVISVADLSQEDPVRMFATAKGDSWDVLVLFKRERIRGATSNTLYYTGSVTDKAGSWHKVLIPEADHHYVVNASGVPVKVSEAGKYVGVTLSLKDRGEYSIALIHSGENWADLSGSAFIKKVNAGLAHFWFDSGNVTARGDSFIAESLPGATGDSYFRFEQTGNNTTGKVKIFFLLENDFTTNAFVVRELEGGAYSSPITMSSVASFPKWGQIEVPITEMLGKVSSFRYGTNKNSPASYSQNMAKSMFYDGHFKAIRVGIGKV